MAGTSRSNWQMSPCPRTCFGKSFVRSMNCDKTRSGVGRGNRRRCENDRRGVSEWRKIRANGLQNEDRSPKSGHRMAAEGMPFPWRWNAGTISTVLDVIWGMSDERHPGKRGPKALANRRSPSGSLRESVLCSGNLGCFVESSRGSRIADCRYPRPQNRY